MKTKMLSALLAALLMLSAFAGCVKTPKPTGAEAPGPDTAVPESETALPEADTLTAEETAIAFLTDAVYAQFCGEDRDFEAYTYYGLSEEDRAALAELLASKPENSAAQASGVGRVYDQSELEYCLKNLDHHRKTVIYYGHVNKLYVHGYKFFRPTYQTLSADENDEAASLVISEDLVYQYDNVDFTTAETIDRTLDLVKFGDKWVVMSVWSDSDLSDMPLDFDLEAALESLYDGYYAIAASSDPAGTEAPEADVTTAPVYSVEALIDAAWDAAAGIGEIYGIEFDKDSALPMMDYVRFTDSLGRFINVAYKRSGDGSMRVDVTDSYMERQWTEGNDELLAWAQKYAPASWSDFYRDYEMVLTPEEIRASGCAATSGSEYLDAVGRCYAEKLRALYLGAEEGTAMHCSEVVIRMAERSLTEADTYVISFSAKPEDPFAFFEFLDYCCMIDDGAEAPERCGWIRFGGEYQLTQREDGSWVGRVFGSNDS